MLAGRVFQINKGTIVLDAWGEAIAGRSVRVMIDPSLLATGHGRWFFPLTMSFSHERFVQHHA
ncbi:MAG: hypothetical protein EB116_19875 [Betaproteobacteria bacterium]|nr:hypothetical protein [Betaproteobacteria bacterium]